MWRKYAGQHLKPVLRRPYSISRLESSNVSLATWSQLHNDTQQESLSMAVALMNIVKYTPDGDRVSPGDVG